MKFKAYSAAKATTLKKGKSKKEAWLEFTRMFHTLHTPTYIYGRYPFHEKIKEKIANRISVGDVYKATSIHQTDIFVTIREWEPNKFFSYDEQMSSKSQPTLSPANTTTFTFKKHSEGTKIKITRIERKEQIFGFWKLIQSMLSDEKSWAAGRLGHIIGGHFIKLKNKESSVLHDFTITRDDSMI